MVNPWKNLKFHLQQKALHAMIKLMGLDIAYEGLFVLFPAGLLLPGPIIFLAAQPLLFSNCDVFNITCVGCLTAFIPISSYKLTINYENLKSSEEGLLSGRSIPLAK